MNRDRVLRVVLVFVGLLFCAAVFPLILMAKQDPALAMMMSLYVTLGIFLLVAARNPPAHRSLIAFAAWSSFAHASVMAMMEAFDSGWHGDWPGVVIFSVIGLALLALAPAKQEPIPAAA